MRPRDYELRARQRAGRAAATAHRQCVARKFLNLLRPALDSHREPGRDRERRRFHQRFNPPRGPSANRAGIGRLAGFYELFRQLLVLFQVGSRWEREERLADWETCEAPFTARLESASIQAERRFELSL